jgi:hypothetical protein
MPRAVIECRSYQHTGLSVAVQGGLLWPVTVDGQYQVGTIGSDIFLRTATDLENKLYAYQRCFNRHLCHLSRNGYTPVLSGGQRVVDINNYRWHKHCRGLFELPVAT